MQVAEKGVLLYFALKCKYVENLLVCMGKFMECTCVHTYFAILGNCLDMCACICAVFKRSSPSRSEDVVEGQVTLSWICLYFVAEITFMICDIFEICFLSDIVKSLPVCVWSCLHMLLHFPAVPWKASRSNDFIMHTRGWGGWR